jgi:hypothetical protein
MPSSVALELERESRSRAQAQLDDLSVDGVLHVLGGCARAHPLDVAPELVSELETLLRALTRVCSHCSLRMFRRGSHDRCGKCGRSNGRRCLGRHDGRDRSIMTVRRRCRPTFRRKRGVVRVGGCFAGVHAFVGESLPDTVGPVLKVRGRACPLKNRASGASLGLCFPIIFFLSHLLPALRVLLHPPRHHRRRVEGSW